MHPAESAGATEILANLSIGYVVFAAFVLTAIRLVLVPSKAPAARSIAELVESLIIAGVLVFMVIRPFFLQAFFIPTESMEPTLLGHKIPEEVHDHIFVDKLSYRLRDPHRGEIIVFKAEKKADSNARNEGREPMENVLIKRLIAVGGDTVEVKTAPDGKMRVFVNDKQLDESPANKDGSCPNRPYCIKEDISEQQGGDFATHGKLKLQPDELFVMGDNRNNSNDGRFWGPLPRNRVIGRALFIFWPLGRIRVVH